MPLIRLVIADRRPIVLQGFASLFAAEGDFRIVASCLDGAGCLEAVRKLTPDVVLVEDGFSDVTASELLAVVTAENLSTRLVFYTASVARGDLADAIAAGACSAIPMREKPETLLQSLRLVAPIPGRAAASKPGNGVFGESGLAGITDQERKIMRLVACGMSNKEIACQLKVATGTVKAQLDHISARLEFKNRTDLATFALSRLYGGVGALAALIFATLDDVHAENATAVGYTHSDTFTVRAADGTDAVVTIKINPKKTAATPGKMAKAMVKAGRVENSLPDTPTRNSKLIEANADILASTITSPALIPPRPGLSSYGTFVMTAVGVWIYELLNSAAQAFHVSDSMTEVVAAAAADGTSEAVAFNVYGGPDVMLDSFDKLAWLDAESRHQSFAFEAPRSDASARSGDEFQAAGGDNISDNNSRHVGSGAIDAMVNQGSFKQAVAADVSRDADHNAVPPSAGDESNRGQSQRDLHASEGHVKAGKPPVKHAPPGDDPNHGQAQRDVHASEEGIAGKQQTKHDLSGDGSNHGQSQRGLHASEDGPAIAKGHVKDDARPGSETQRGLHEAHLTASKNLHEGPTPNAGGNNQATDNSGEALSSSAHKLGDHFHFKNETAVAKDSYVSEVHVGHRPNSMGSDLHTVGNDGGTPIQDADLFGPSHADQIAVDHARGLEHHLTHDLLM